LHFAPFPSSGSTDEQTPNARLFHKSCTLLNALWWSTGKGSGAASATLPEFQWELNSNFSPLFTDRESGEIRRCLDIAGFFSPRCWMTSSFRRSFDSLGPTRTPSAACLEILAQLAKVVGCEDLMERLEAEGKIWEELIPRDSRSVLRDHVEHLKKSDQNRFRATLWQTLSKPRKFWPVCSNLCRR